VILVEDIWDQDLLHVSFDAEQVTTEQMLATIKDQGFEAEIRAD
jgi:hypothetical protein